MRNSFCEGRTVFAMKDHNPNAGVKPVSNVSAALGMHLKGWSLHWSVNQFKGARKPENCTKVLSWVFEMEKLSKEEQLKRIYSSITPSLVVESVNGFHVYFDAIDGTVQNYRSIQERLIHYYGSDPQVKGVNRMLRMPYTIHTKHLKADENTAEALKAKLKEEYEKTPTEVFCKKLSKDERLSHLFGKYMTRIYDQNNVEYTEDEMFEIFPEPPQKEQKPQERFLYKPKMRTRGVSEDSLNWFRDLNCLDALKALSGTAAVRFDTFTFKTSSNGNQNIIANGHGTPCFVDPEGKIGGSANGGGPTIVEWVNWYHNDLDVTHDYLKQYLK